MVFFGHAGIALGAAVFLNGIFRGAEKEDLGRDNEPPAERQRARHPGASWIVSLSRRLDLRLLLLGAVVSDVIDKPAGFIFYGTFGCRLFCHSLMFLMMAALAGSVLYAQRHKNWLLVLAFGILTHLALDEMWLDAQTFLWPSEGFSFPTIERGGWAEGVLRRLLTSPRVYVPELLGLAVVVWIGWLLVRRRSVRAFVRCGRI